MDKITNTEGKIVFAKLANKETASSTEANDKILLKQLTSHSRNITYYLERTYKGSLGYVHKVYKALFRNVKVTGGLAYTLHLETGK